MTDLTLMHDTELLQLPEGEPILAARTRGASLVRLTLARMYGSADVATATQWSIVPHVTERGTIGVVDVARGTAWDSMVEATDDVRALGLDDEHTPEGNHPSLAVPVRFDGKVVQERGQTSEAPITAPPGWKRIGLPTWRGWYGDGRQLVPREKYEKPLQIRPRLRAVGLMTCYGTPGEPRGMLADGAGHLDDSIRPDWVHPRFEGPRFDAIAESIPEDIRRDLVIAARRYLGAQIRHVLRGTPIEDAVDQALDADDRTALWQLLNPRRDDDETAIYCAYNTTRSENARSVLNRDTRFAQHVLWSIGSGLDVVGGASLDGLLIDALEYVALERTRAARDQIFATLEAHANGRNVYTCGLREMLGPFVRTIMQWIYDSGPTGFMQEALSILYRNGPIWLDQPAELYVAQG